MCGVSALGVLFSVFLVGGDLDIGVLFDLCVDLGVDLHLGVDLELGCFLPDRLDLGFFRGVLLDLVRGPRFLRSCTFALAGRFLGAVSGNYRVSNPAATHQEVPKLLKEGFGFGLMRHTMEHILPQGEVDVVRSLHLA
jgi:hypothetical protein